MLVQDRHSARHAQPVTTGSPDAGVIEEARSRQRRHRRAGAALSLAIALAAWLAYFGAAGDGGHNRRPPSPPSKGEGSFVQTASLRLPRGRTTTTILIKAPADHAFDVSLRSASAAAVVLTTNFGVSPGPEFQTMTDRQDCRTVAASTSCVIHFAAGGNAGGTWRWTVTKTSIPAARVYLKVWFNPHRGDYSGHPG